MKSLFAFLKKEWLDFFRSGKLFIIGGTFVALGILNPAIAKITPWLFDLLSEQMAEGGVVIESVKVDATTSWVQFFKNIPIGLIVFFCVFGSIFTKEYEKGSLILILTKGFDRKKVVFCKTIMMVIVWSVGYWLCYGITYLYNAYFWDNSVAKGIIPAVFNWWIFGIFIISLIVLFSVVVKNYSGVLLSVGACVLFLYAVSVLPRVGEFNPIYLINTNELLLGVKQIGDFAISIIITIAISVACITASFPIFNKRSL